MSPNEELLKNYCIKKVETIEFFTKNERTMPMQLCVWRPIMGLFHFYIIAEITKDYIYVVHKTNKDPEHLVAAFVLGFNEFTKIKVEKIPIVQNKLTKKLFDFESGVYVLGDYTDEQKQKATERLNSMKGKKQIFSFKSCNCEHFSNWIFTGFAESYQAKLIASKSIFGDAYLESLKQALPDLANKGAGGLAVGSLKEVAKWIISKAPEASATLKNAATKALPILETAGKSKLALAGVGVLIQLPIEIIQLSIVIHKLKKDRDDPEKKMQPKHFNREVTKRVCGSVGALSGAAAGAAAGAAIGAAAGAIGIIK